MTEAGFDRRGRVFVPQTVTDVRFISASADRSRRCDGSQIEALLQSRLKLKKKTNLGLDVWLAHRSLRDAKGGNKVGNVLLPAQTLRAGRTALSCRQQEIRCGCSSFGAIRLENGSPVGQIMGTWSIFDSYIGNNSAQLHRQIDR